MVPISIAIPELGVTCLWYSVHIAENDDVKLLLEHGADPDIASRTWRSPIEEALQNDDQGMLSILAEYQAKQSGSRRRLVRQGFLGLWQWHEGCDEKVQTIEEKATILPEVSHAQGHSHGNGGIVPQAG